MAGVSLSNVKKRFGLLEVIHGVSFDVSDGEFVVFVGPSGCGKSTLLRMIAGLEDVTEGEIFIGEKMVNDVDPAERGTAMVFQSYALYPHMTVEQNLNFGLRMTGNDKADTQRRVDQAADILQITNLLGRRPKQLSGGQRQRVAIGRAIVREPSVFLFDEPLSNLDAELRVQMRVELSRLHAELGTTMIYVTHDQTEAMTLADRIVVMNDGNVEQIGKPLEIYDDPANKFVAGFVGSPRMNFLDARVVKSEAGSVTLELANYAGVTLTKAVQNPPAVGTKIALGVRPEHFEEGGVGDCDLTVKIDVAEHLGSASYVYANVQSSEQLIIQRDASIRDIDQQAVVSIIADLAYLFSTDGQRIR